MRATKTVHCNPIFICCFVVGSLNFSFFSFHLKTYYKKKNIEAGFKSTFGVPVCFRILQSAVMRRKTTKKGDFFASEGDSDSFSLLYKPVGSLFSLCAGALLGTRATGELGMLSYAGGEVPASCAWDISEREAGGRTCFN